ncbi:MAG: trypsin-like peptidase domain-containing protein [Nitrospirota bacterium]
MRIGRAVSLVVLLLGSWSFRPVPEAAWAIGVDAEEERTVRLYQHLAPATVFLSSAYVAGHHHGSPRPPGVGAGFILDEAGTVLTNAHVVEGATAIMATLYGGQRVKAEVIGLDAYTDVALLRLVQPKDKLETVKLGDSDRLKVGQKTLVVGSPFGLGFTLSTGIVSGLGPLPNEAGRGGLAVIQTTAPINPGNSGGPLVDSEGRVVGITTAMLAGAQNIGFAIPINLVKGILPELKEKGRVTRPWLGVAGKFMTQEIRLLFALPLADGFLVEDVAEGSPAASAGVSAGSLDVVVEGVPWLLGGDIITGLQGQPVISPQDFYQIVRGFRVGQSVQIDLLREGQRRRVSVVLRDRPAEKPQAPALPVGQALGVTPSGLRAEQESLRFSF